MTALTQYDRLEATALWRPGAEAQRREVLVSLGKATLTVSTLAETALTHWSLAAVDRLNPGEVPALYAPDGASGEVLEVAEPDMVAALERVRRAIARRKPKPGRLRRSIGAAALAASLALVFFWLPAAVVDRTARLLPPASRAAIGADLLAEIEALTGPACRDGAGVEAMADLSYRLFGHGGPRIVVLPTDVGQTAHLPGGILLVDRRAIEDFEDPAVLAGYLLAEDVRRGADDATARLLRTIGPWQAGRLLVTGRLSAAALRAEAARRLLTPPQSVATADLLARFEAAEVPTRPYALALDISGETTLPLIEADPFRSDPAPELIPDAAWVQLQQICG